MGIGASTGRFELSVATFSYDPRGGRGTFAEGRPEHGRLSELGEDTT